MTPEQSMAVKGNRRQATRSKRFNNFRRGWIISWQSYFGNLHSIALPTHLQTPQCGVISTTLSLDSVRDHLLRDDDGPINPQQPAALIRRCKTQITHSDQAPTYPTYTIVSLWSSHSGPAINLAFQFHFSSIYLTTTTAANSWSTQFTSPTLGN